MNLTEMVYFIAVLGAVLGVLWRAIFPFLKKKAEKEKKGIVEKFRIERFFRVHHLD